MRRRTERRAGEAEDKWQQRGRSGEERHADVGGGATASFCRGDGGGRMFVIGDRENAY